MVVVFIAMFMFMDMRNILELFMDSKARIMHRQLDCLVALARIGLRGLCFSGVVVFIAMQQLSLDIMDRAQTQLLALLGCLCLTLH